PGEKKVQVDINRAIQTSLTMATNEWKYVADLETDFNPELPLPYCYAGEIHQVILNLIVNAAYAIREMVQSSSGKGRLRLATCVAGECVEFRVADNGTGIRDDHRERVFDPFFTTKQVGQGTGQGLAIAY